MPFPTLPENFGALDLTELKALRDALKAALNEAKSDIKPETAAAMGQALADLETVRERITFKTALDSSLDEDDSEPEPTVDEDSDVEPEEDPETDPDDEEDEEVVVEEVEPEKVPVGATTSSSTYTTSTTPAVILKPTGRTMVKAPKDKPVDVARLQAMQGSGKPAGDFFGSWAELAEAMFEKAQTLSPNSMDRIPIARVDGGYDKVPGRVLDERIDFNLARFEPDELTAALCAPFTPYYGMSCQNTARRPVFNSLPQFQAPRGGVSIYPSPTLSDITDGTGVWTHLDDANPTAVKADCQTIECATPVDYVMYAVYRCLTVKNMLQMTFPELLEAYLNRLAAAWARMAEKRLLALMGANVDTLQGEVQKVGANESILTTMLRYMALYQERQRWDYDSVEAWLPRWLLPALKADLLHQRRTDGGKSMPTDGDVTATFRNAGANVHWYLDEPVWRAAAHPSQPAGDGNLAQWPTEVAVLLAPPGKFALIDRGELRVGVSGNNIYRDITQLMRNEFTFFFESFEGIVDTNSCPADIVEFPVCFNGVQVADVTVDCDLV